LIKENNAGGRVVRSRKVWSEREGNGNIKETKIGRVESKNPWVGRGGVGRGEGGFGGNSVNPTKVKGRKMTWKGRRKCRNLGS